MLTHTVRRLPGFRFEAQSPLPTEVLPAMDVAVFVGFAASGPLHRPVRVEDVAGFTAIFGDEAPLVWNAEQGEPVYAYLAPAVRAFFRNGGRACWIIRVASEAETNYFPIPCLAQAQFDESGKVWQVQPAFAPARSEGSWSDGVRVATALLNQSLDLNPISIEHLEFTVKVSSPRDITPGDLVRLKFSNNRLLLFAVKKFDSDLVATLPDRDRLGIRGHKAVWLAESWSQLPPSSSGQAYTFTHDRPSAPIAAAVPLRRDEPLSPTGLTLDWPQSEKAPLVKINLDIPFTHAPQPGSLLRIDFGSDSFWLVVQDVRAADEDSSPPFDGVQVIGQGVWWLNSGPDTMPTEMVEAELLTFELWTRQGETNAIRLSDLGFEAKHPRCWDALPTDAQLFPDPNTLPRNNHIGLRQAAANPRFPLAGNEAAESLYVPIAMPITPDYFLTCDPTSTTALERDGLSNFRASLFLDPDLAEVGTLDLLAQADFIRYQGANGRTLTGIHAALSIDEATIIAAPDLIHQGWFRLDSETPPLPLPSQPLERPEWWHFLDCDPLPKFERVSQPKWENFLNCNILGNWINPPQLSDIEPDLTGTFTLSWMASPPQSGLIYTLQEAIRPDFKDAVDIYTGAQSQITLYGRMQGLYYYRVNAAAQGFTSDWSNGIVIQVKSPTQWRLKPEKDYSTETLPELLRGQRALLRMCAARSDLFAVLALPAHYREDEAIEHGDTLVNATVDLFSQIDDRTLSFAAIYHPWLIGREESRLTEFRRTPPDGAMCGLMAQRTLARGAWIAPANEPLRGVVALTPPMARERRLDFLEAQINLIRQEPRGFLALAADTLSGDGDLRPLNVRRLLILIRRLALRLGATYVFEPHSGAFRRAVQRGFEAMLEEMFGRGAFAGRTTDTSFQVVTDEVLNPPHSVDQGRFIVELRIAPSQPLEFLTIRLVQTGDRTLVTQER